MGYSVRNGQKTGGEREGNERRKESGGTRFRGHIVRGGKNLGGERRKRSAKRRPGEKDAVISKFYFEIDGGGIEKYENMMEIAILRYLKKLNN